MTLKLLHLNILYGRYIEHIIDYVKHQRFDVLCFQEVAGGKVSQHRTDNFDEIVTRLGYRGEKAISWDVTGHPGSYEANAIFFTPDITLLHKDVVWLKDYRPTAAFETREFQDDPRTALQLTLEKEGKRFTVITTHLSWGRTSEDDENKLSVGRRLYERIKRVEKPYILTGDFNVNPKSQVVKWIDTLARNLTVENHVLNTLNPRTHKAPHLFPPGLAVDYIYVSDDVTVNNFRVLPEDLSDHLGLTLEAEL